MPAPRDRLSLIKAARMYFLDGRSQDDIARAIGTSRSNVSRMLSAARAQGVVEIRVHDSTADLRYLVLPMRPAGTEGLGEAALAALVTRDCMIGMAIPEAPPP